MFLSVVNRYTCSKRIKQEFLLGGLWDGETNEHSD